MTAYQTERYIHVVLLHGNNIEKSQMVKKSGQWMDKVFDLHNLVAPFVDAKEVGVVQTKDEVKPEDGLYVYINYYNGNQFYDTDFKLRGWCAGNVLKSFESGGCVCLLTCQPQWNNTLKLEIINLKGDFETLWFKHTKLTYLQKDNVDITDNGDTLGIVRDGQLFYYSLDVKPDSAISTLLYTLDLKSPYEIVSFKWLDKASFVYQAVKDDRKILTNQTMGWDLKRDCNDLLNKPHSTHVNGGFIDFSYYWKAFCLANRKRFGFLSINCYSHE